MQGTCIFPPEPCTQITFPKPTPPTGESYLRLSYEILNTGHGDNQQATKNKANRSHSCDTPELLVHSSTRNVYSEVTLRWVLLMTV
jgi:hypothetical protein